MVTDELHINITADTGNAASNIQNTANALNTLGDSAKTADTDMSDLVKAMSDAAANMVSISQNIATSAAGLTGFQSSIDAVSSSLQGVNTYFDALNAHIQQSYSAFDGAATSVTGLSTASEQSAAALNGIVAATDGFADRMDLLSDTTHGTTTGMVSLQKELQDTLTQMRGFADSMGTAGKDAQDTSRKIRELAEDVEKLAKSSNSSNTAVLSLASGFKTLKGIVATLGIGKFIKDSNDAYNVQMQNELKLTAHMKQRMNATDDEVQSIKDLAAAQQQLGVIGDEIQLAGAQQLTTYAKQTTTLKTLLPAMNNLIAQNAGYEASVGDATSAADMLGRALNGQYTSLKRMGVTFTEAQEQVLKYGTESQKAAVLADAINSKVGNMNEILAQTPTGKMKQLQNEFGDLQEQIGATFQPLITAIVPVLKGVMDALTVPIINVSRGITIIGKAIASIDSPAVRAIGLAAAGVAIMYKLKAAIGSTSAGLLVLGVILSGLVGSMSQEQDSIADIVNTAYDSATAGANKATDAAKNYDEQLQDVQKTASKLAGFDTITKLSGSSSGSLVSSLFSDSDIQGLYDLTDAAIDAKTALDFSDITAPKLDFSEVQQKASIFVTSLDQLFKNRGNDDGMYQPLLRMTDIIKGILDASGLDGTAITDFFKSLGGDVYNAFNGNEVEGLRGLTKKIEDLLNAVHLDGTGFINFWKGVGAQIYDMFGGLFSAFDDLAKGDIETAANKYIKGMTAEGGFLQVVGNMSANPILGPVASIAGQSLSDMAEQTQKALTEGTPEYRESSVHNNDGRFGGVGRTRFTDIPLQPTGISSVPESAKQYINVYINGEQYDYEKLEMTNGY